MQTRLESQGYVCVCRQRRSIDVTGKDELRIEKNRVIQKHRELRRGGGIGRQIARPIDRERER